MTPISHLKPPNNVFVKFRLVSEPSPNFMLDLKKDQMLLLTVMHVRPLWSNNSLHAAENPLTVQTCKWYNYCKLQQKDNMSQCILKICFLYDHL